MPYWLTLLPFSVPISDKFLQKPGIDHRHGLQWNTPEGLVQNISEAHYRRASFSVRLNQDKERRK